MDAKNLIGGAWLAVQTGVELVMPLAGQLFRIFGAATKTAFGLVPAGNTGGTDVSPFRTMPIPTDLQTLMRAARSND
jgi:hypothetical protein